MRLVSRSFRPEKKRGYRGMSRWDSPATSSVLVMMLYSPQWTPGVEPPSASKTTPTSSGTNEVQSYIAAARTTVRRRLFYFPLCPLRSPNIFSTGHALIMSLRVAQSVAIRYAADRSLKTLGFELATSASRRTGLIPTRGNPSAFPRPPFVRMGNGISTFYLLLFSILLIFSKSHALIMSLRVAHP